MNILLAEDDSNISTIAKLVLEKMGRHTVTVAANGTKALELATTNSFELIILDGMMPGLSGIEVAQKIRNLKNISAPVIFMSAKSNQQDVKEFLELGAGYIQKPFEPKELCSKIDEILKKAVA